MVFSEDYDNLTAYGGEPMKNTFGDIVDLRWSGIFNLNNYMHLSKKTPENLFFIKI